MMKKQIRKGLLFFALSIGLFLTPIICYASEDTGIPVYGSSIKDGSYEVEMTSSSSMFRIVKAKLVVSDGDMNVTMTLSGVGYLRLFAGTGEEALSAPEEMFIPFVEDEEGAYTYTIPVKALGEEFDCAAFSKRKQKWYDRKLSVLASSLPKDAYRMKDGNYTMDVTLNGGSGRANIVSPAQVTVSQGAAMASVVWSSPDYDYMMVDGRKYLPVNTKGNSVFEIPISVWDEEMEVTADTVAMSKPHEIAYTLTFHSDTLKKESGLNVMAIITAAACVILVFAVALIIIKTQKKKA